MLPLCLSVAQMILGSKIHSNISLNFCPVHQDGSWYIALLIGRIVQAFYGYDNVIGTLKKDNQVNYKFYFMIVRELRILLATIQD